MGRVAQRATVALPDGVEAPVADGLSHRFRIRGAATGSGSTFHVQWQSTVLPPRGALIRDQASEPRVSTGAFAFDPLVGVAVATAEPPGPPAAPQIEVPQAQRLAVPGQQYFSADMRNRLASVPGRGATADSYEWSIFDATGNLIGSFSNRAAYAPFHVSGDLVVFETRPGARRQGDRMVEEPLGLRTVSLSSGAEQWRLPIRDTEYRGPFPP